MDSLALVSELERIVGKAKILTDRKSLNDYARDMADNERIPSVVVRPSSEDEVAKVVEIANRSLTPILARGAGSSLTGAAVLAGGIILDMRGLNKVLKVDAINWYVQVQPGITLEELNLELKRYGFFFPPDPASSYICTVGGAIAEGSGGLRCVKYGTMKDWILSVRLVLSSGKVVKLGEPLAKNRAGYDLLHLIVGSEGTLGVITEAHLKIIPIPATPSQRLLVTFDSWESVSDTLVEIRKTDIVPGLFEFLDRDHIHALNVKLGNNLDEAEATLLIDVDRPDLQRTVDLMKAHGATRIDIARNEEEADDLYQIRSMALLAVKSLAPATQVEDVTVPIDKLGDYFRLVKNVAAKHNLRIPVMGHAGDGNVHPMVLYDNNSADERKSASEAFDEICRHAIEMGGSITGEHGVGFQKMKLLREQLERRNGAEALQLMKKIKEVFDPNGIMNPGKYVQGA